MERLSMIATRTRKKVHPDADLQTASDYLEYHIRMFVETLLWLRERLNQGGPKDIVWNAVLEDYLVHARLLIHFVCKTGPPRDDDVIAIHYFHDLPNRYTPLNDAYLADWAAKIGGNLVHITTKPMPTLKSQQIWPIDEIAARLAPGLIIFANLAPDTRLVADARNDYLRHLAKLVPPVAPVSTNAAT